MEKGKTARIINGSAAPPAINQTPVKFWNIAECNGDEAELTLYGEIRSRRPLDWWTGKPIEGLFITPEEFLEDLKTIKNKSKITIRINSVGGDLYTALGIYTQLKGLTGEKTVIIDGIAASAATVIAMAGDVRKIPSGSLFMIHEAAIEIWGNYKQKDIAGLDNLLEAANKAAAETYASNTDKSIEEIRTLMAEETWMTGKEAVEKGFADEVLFDSDPQISMSSDKSLIFINGQPQNIALFKNIPQNIPISNSISTSVVPQMALSQAENNTNHNTNQGGKENVNTVEELRKAHPNLVKQIENTAMQAGRLDGAREERERIQAIEEIQAAIGDDELATQAKYGENPQTAEQLAFAAMKKQANLGAAFLQNLQLDSNSSGTNNVPSTPNGGNEDDPKAIEEQKEAQAAAMIASAGETKKGEK